MERIRFTEVKFLKFIIMDFRAAEVQQKNPTKFNTNKQPTRSEMLVHS